MITGVVESVDEVRRGVISTSWVGNDLFTGDASELDRSGGMLSPDDGETTFAFTAVVDGDPDVVVMADVPPAGGTVRVELLTDGGMESGSFAGWAHDAGWYENSGTSTIPVHSGSWMAQSTTAGATLSQSVPCVGGETLHLSVWSQSPPVGTGHVTITPDVGTAVTVQLLTGAPLSWQQSQADVTVDAAAQTVRVDVVSDGTDWTRVDDVSLTALRSVGSGWPQPGTDATTGDPVPADVRMDVWPPVTDVWAQVAAGGTVVPCLVPHSLRPLLVSGTRDAGETVQADLVAGVWTVTDVLGETPQITGTDYFSPGPDVTPRAEMVGPNFRIVRSDGDDGEIVTASLGGDDGDFIQLSEDGINPSVSFASDGSGALSTLDVSDDLTLSGTSITDIISPCVNGIVSAYDFTADTYTVGAECGFVDLAFDAVPGRSYRIVFDGYVYTSAAARFQMFFRAHSSGDGMTSAAPTIANGALWQSGIFYNPNSGASLYRVHLERTLIPNTNYSNTSQYRVLLSAATLTSGTTLYIAGSTVKSQFYIEDMGIYSGGYNDAVANSGGGTPSSGTAVSPPAASKKTYTVTWNASSTKTWRGTGVATDYLQQGYYGGYQRYSVILFPSLTSTLSGSTVQSVKLYLKNASWYYSAGGTARIGHYSGGLPSSPQTSGGGAFSVASWSPGAAKWVTLPSRWYSGIKDGNINGVTLGEGAGTSETFYGKFSHNLSDIKIQVTYIK